MVKKNVVRLGVMVALTFGITACHHSPEQRADWVVSKVSSELNLTADQKTKLEAVKQAFLGVRKTHQGDRAKHIEDVKQLILSDHLDSAKIKSMMSQREKFMDENLDAIFPKVADFHSSLTPEQKKKAVDLLEKFASHWD